MIRILHVVGKMDRAGAETMIMNLYRSIDRNQYQFDFVVFSNQPGDYDKEIVQLGGKIYVIATSNQVKRFFALKRLLQVHPEYRIIHSHTLLSNAFHLLAAKLANVKMRIAHAHSTNDLYNKNFIGKLYKLSSVRIINKSATHFLACGEAAAKFLFPYQKDFLLLPNAIDTFYFADIGNKKKNYLNQLYNLKDDYLKIIQIGRLQPVKNHIFSIQIAKELKRNKIPFRMFFVGQGELYKKLEQQIQKNYLSEEIILMGLRSDIPQIMAGADVLLMPSLHEGFPVVLVESQSVGIPALISDSISNEVDLKLDLVEFESIRNNISNWVEKILKLKSKKRLETKSRLKIISDRGYDIHTSADLLSELYKTTY